MQAFMRVQTQLGPNGFNYSGVESGLRLAGLEITPDLFGKLQIMELEVLAAMAEQQG